MDNEENVMDSRIGSVDVFRLLAIMAVISIHTAPFQGDLWADSIGGNTLSFLINQLAKFAVPFFFVISGYFWGRKVEKTGSVYNVSLAMAKRIFMIFVVWSVFYAIPFRTSAVAEYGLLGPIKLIYWHWIVLLKDPITLVMEGTKEHLWFLMALLFAVGINACFVREKRIRLLLAVSIALYLVGLLAKSYSTTPIGLNWHFNTRNGPFFATLLFASGYILSQWRPDSGWFFKGLAIFSGGLILQLAEMGLLMSVYGVNPFQQDYVAGTYFMGLGVAVMALSNREFLRFPILGKVGKYALGIYAVHVVFVEGLRPLGRSTAFWLWEIGYIVLVLIFSVITVMLVSKIKIFRKILV